MFCWSHRLTFYTPDKISCIFLWMFLYSNDILPSYLHSAVFPLVNMIYVLLFIFFFQSKFIFIADQGQAFSPLAKSWLELRTDPCWTQIEMLRMTPTSRGWEGKLLNSINFSSSSQFAIRSDNQLGS